MSVHRLPAKLALMGVDFQAIAETGVCREILSDDKIRVSRYTNTEDDGASTMSWTMTADALSQALQVRVGDPVSAVLFSPDGKPSGSMFLAYNHRSREWRYYPAAFGDLLFNLPKDVGWWGWYRAKWRVRKMSARFENSDFFLASLRYVSALHLNGERG